MRRNGWWAAVVESVDSRLWPVPVVAVVAAVILGIALPRIDLLIDASLPTAVDSIVFNGGADTARSVLSSIAGSLITATSLTFSLTVVALQLASSQASPRVLRLFARDRQVHWTLAVFLGTFAYSITVLRSVRSSTEDIPEFIPRVAVTVAFGLTLLSVIMLVFFLAHLAAQLRVETMLKDIHAETDRSIDRLGERNASAPAFTGPVDIPADRHIVRATSSGFVTAHDHPRLMRLAVENAIVIQEHKRVGENVVAGTPLALWWSIDPARPVDDVDSLDGGIRDAYAIGYERTSAEDIGHGVQQILDIGLRALSAGVNDPTTAVNALGHLTAVTARMIAMPPLPAALADREGRLCILTLSPSAADHVDAALSPLRHYCTDHPAVVTRFVQAVDELFHLSDDPGVTTALMGQLDALADQLRVRDEDPASTSQLLAMITRVRHDRGSVTID
ncbi:DUF2254 domain-containing protein [Microbacterium sp. SLBN-146]|uniref:DUF2254 domain-containing protein n=1 Tax=Microbacterium sp. SLBN-146 TaxID=2768457 RepID=UPI001169B1B6|nr:DUF2254 domain-containing protein [Microbacterium sp. SLBN-146]TQJ30746.1 putative membrane protein [Microbacterium sp. SLBN-146]